MPQKLFLLLVSLLFLVVSCSKDADNSPSSAASKKAKKAAASYVSTGDLPEIISHGKIRLAAPKFDGADALPRSGLPVSSYQEVAEQLAMELGLDVVWVYVDGFAGLIPALNEGRADIIITNMSITKARKEDISFTNSISRVKEVVVGAKNLKLDTLADLQNIAISIPEGTAYVESLQALQAGDGADKLNIQLLETGISDSDLIEGILNGDYQATVLDDDIVQAYLPAYPDIKKGMTIKKRRKIAWAVRKDNPLLLTYINEFLVSHHVRASSNKNEKRSFSQIKTSGRLRMLTTNNPASYFMYRGELMGFDYELMKKFADQQGLHLSVILKDSIPELFEALEKGEGDVVASSITATPEREAMGLRFSKPYLNVQEQLVSRLDTPEITSFEQLNGEIIGVNPDTVFYERLRAIKQQGGNFVIHEYPGTTTEELIDLLEKHEFDFTVADSHLVAIEQAYHKQVKATMNVTDEAGIAWVVRPDQQTLKTTLDAFIKKQYRGLYYNVTYNKYFKNSRKIHKYQDGRVTQDSGLSPFDDLVKSLADTYGMDWRLVTAQMYQESKFNPNAKSFAGALGLMQVLPRTAQQFGYSALKKPEQGIAAGVAYLDWLDDRFPQNLNVDQRIYFTLAAYNAGTGHVRDAMSLARQLGYDPYYWFNNVEKAMLLLSEPEYYKKSRFGYVRGSEPVHYVKSIRDRYLAYLNAGIK
ncbi:Membrane-bound lytic murein transglycosylase F [Thalassocella blandensis]|nr:Membrane-bound lytic murein transglycosylase F [Thalassocella blandensis]